MQIPSPATSFAIDLVSPMSAAFDAEYATIFGMPSLPANWSDVVALRFYFQCLKLLEEELPDELEDAAFTIGQVIVGDCAETTRK